MMRKYVKIMVLALLMVGLVSGSAFAAATLNAGNSSAASELISPTVDYVVPSIPNAYQPNGSVAGSSVLRVSLTNGLFATGTLDICLGAVSQGTGAVAASGLYADITVGAGTPLGAGVGPYTLSATAGCAGAPAAGLVGVSLPAGSLAGTIMTMTVDNKNLPGDTNVYATAPVLTVKDQFSLEFTPVTSVITFASGMKLLSTGGLAAVTTSKFNFDILSDETIVNKVPTSNAATTCVPDAAGTGTFKFTATPGAGYNFSGIAAATGFAYQINNAGGAVIDVAITTAKAAATGNVIPGGVGLIICGSSATAATKLAAGHNQFVLVVDGATVLTPRTYTIGAATVTGAPMLAAARNLMATATGWSWVIDSSQYYVPLVGSSAAAGRETYIKLQSKNVAAGANGVSIAILANDGTTVATWTGTITAGTPLTITGAQLVAAATAAGKVVDGAAGFAAIVTVNAPEADVFAYANMVDAAGAKRIPMKTVAGTISE